MLPTVENNRPPARAMQIGFEFLARFYPGSKLVLIRECPHPST